MKCSVSLDKAAEILLTLKKPNVRRPISPLSDDPKSPVHSSMFLNHKNCACVFRLGVSRQKLPLPSSLFLIMCMILTEKNCFAGITFVMNVMNS